MKSKRCLYLACLLAVGTLPLAAKPVTLAEFWKEWHARNLDLQTKGGERFIRDHALDWKPSMIPAMIRDAQTADPNEAEERDYVYTFAILYIPDRAGCKAIIAKIRASPGADTKTIGNSDTTDDIAYDFQSAIDDIETGQEKLPDLN